MIHYHKLMSNTYMMKTTLQKKKQEMKQTKNKNTHSQLNIVCTRYREEWEINLI